MNKKVACLVLFLAFIIFVSVLAYTKHIPTEIKAVPFYDSVGHFILFGTLGLLAYIALQPRGVSLWGIWIPAGPLLAATYAAVDELLQFFSPNRTFDWGDLFFGLAGIVTFVMVYSLIQVKVVNNI